MFIDISKAYLHADVLNDSIYVELPGELNMPNMCGRQLRALYGTAKPPELGKRSTLRPSKE